MSIYQERPEKPVEEKRMEDNANRYFTKTYIDVEDFKKYI